MINTKIMNDCLLAKWIWRISQGAEETWYRLLKAKYMMDDNFFRSVRTSQFWQGLHKIKHLFKWGAVHKVQDGKQTTFWEDVWVGDTPLKTQFPELYRMSRASKACMANCFDQGAWSVRRILTANEAISYGSLLNLLQPLQTSETGGDKVDWGLAKIFTTNSLYTFITHMGVYVKNSENMWKTQCSPENQILPVAA